MPSLRLTDREATDVTAYLLTSTISVPLYGKFGDIAGRKNIFQAAICIFIVGSMLSGLAHNMAELIAFLCSSKAGFCTGADYKIDGGLTAGIGVK